VGNNRSRDLLKHFGIQRKLSKDQCWGTKLNCHIYKIQYPLPPIVHKQVVNGVSPPPMTLMDRRPTNTPVPCIPSAANSTTVIAIVTIGLSVLRNGTVCHNQIQRSIQIKSFRGVRVQAYKGRIVRIFKNQIDDPFGALEECGI